MLYKRKWRLYLILNLLLVIGAFWCSQSHKEQPLSFQEAVTASSEKNKRAESVITEALWKISLDEIKNSPLWTMKGVPHDFGSLLGYNQAETIMRDYNSRSGTTFDPQSPYSGFESLNFPLQYPDFKIYFSENIEKMNTELHLGLSSQELENPHIILVAKAENLSLLAYYQSGSIKMITSVSLWTPKTRTKAGKYPLTLEKKNYRSNLYGTPMPYAIRFHGPYFLHQEKSDGSDISHGCVRVPGLYQKRLYEQLPNIKKQKENWIPKPIIVVHKPYESTLSWKNQTLRIK